MNENNNKLHLFLESKEFRTKLLFDFLLLNNSDSNNKQQTHKHKQHHDENIKHSCSSSDDTKFEKIFDRLKDIMSNDEQVVELDYKFNLLDRTIYSINQRYAEEQRNSNNKPINLHQDTTTDLQRLVSSNLRLLGVLLSFPSILYKFILPPTNQQSSTSLIKLVTSELINSSNSLIKNNAILLIKEIIESNKTNSSILESLLFGGTGDENKLFIQSIFESFNYPSTFVTRTSTELISTLFIVQIDYINSIIIDHIKELLLQDSTSNDIKLCILDFSINLLNHLKNGDGNGHQNGRLVEYIKNVDLICTLCSLILDRNRLVRSRSIEMLNVIIENKNSDYLNIGSTQFFKSIIQKLLLPLSDSTINKESLITVIDLIGALDNSFLFPPTIIINNNNQLSSFALFNQLETLVKILLNRDQSLIDDTSIYQFHLFQCTKEILKRNDTSTTNTGTFNDDWIKYVVECCLLKSNFNNISNKTHKEAFECLSRFEIMKWIEIKLDNQQFQIGNGNGVGDIALFTFLKSTLKLSKPILKESFNALIKIIMKLDQIRNKYNVYHFDQEFINCISSLTMSLHSDIRDITLGFLKRIFQCEQCNHFKQLVYGGGEQSNLSILLEIILKRLTDSDNYVRSSALELISVISMDINGWNSCCNLKEPFKQIEQLHLILKETPVLNINDDICNNNQINLSNYTNLLEKEINDRSIVVGDQQPTTTQEKNHLFYSDAISTTSSIENKPYVNNRNDESNQDWEWEDQEFQELLSRNNDHINSSFMNEDDDYNNFLNNNDISLAPNLLNYKFPHSIILFLNDEDSYPRISSIELLISWVNIPHCYSFIHKLINDDQENEKYSINSCISNLMSDNGYWEVKSKLLDLFSSLLHKECGSGGLQSIIKLGVVELLIENIKNNLEDKIIRTKSLNCLSEIINLLNSSSDNGNGNCDDNDNQFNSLLSFINENIDLEKEKENCSSENDFTEHDDQDIQLFNQQYNNDNNVPDCY